MHSSLIYWSKKNELRASSLRQQNSSRNQASPILEKDILEELYNFLVRGAHFIVVHTG